MEKTLTPCTWRQATILLYYISIFITVGGIKSQSDCIVGHLISNNPNVSPFTELKPIENRYCYRK